MNGHPITILLIEDNAGDARLIREMITEANRDQFDLIEASRLSIGCEYLAKGGIDVVLLDLGLPDSQGLDTLAQVQAAAPHTPIVVLTGLDDDELGVNAVRRGAQDYLVKGQVESNLLVRVITYAIERKQAEQQRLELTMERERVKLLASFVEDASHEFRTPLAVIHSGIELLERVVDLEKHASRIERLKEQIMHIVKLVDALLVMSQLDGGAQFVFVPLNLNSLIRELEAEFYTPVREKALTLTLNLDNDICTIQGDKQRLHQAFTHFVENAVRYTPAQGTIEVQTYMQANYVVTAIRDTGIGISETDLPHIFERFYRADKARTSRGVGLGLSIARKIIESHQGTIEVESELGKGSTFRVLLPVNTP